MKRMPHIYIGAWGRYAFILFNRNRSSQVSKHPRSCIEKMMSERYKKIAPAAPKERKKQKSERGLTPTGLIGGGNKQLIAKNHSEKTINEPWIRHDLKYTQLHGCNQPIKGNSHNQHTHHHYEASRNRNRFGKRYEHDKRMITTPSSPLPDTRGGAGKRDERGSEMSGTGGEPQSAEQARADSHMTGRHG